MTTPTRGPVNDDKNYEDDIRSFELHEIADRLNAMYPEVFIPSFDGLVKEQMMPEKKNQKLKHNLKNLKNQKRKKPTIHFKRWAPLSSVQVSTL